LEKRTLDNIFINVDVAFDYNWNLHAKGTEFSSCSDIQHGTCGKEGLSGYPTK
jgi:hypothetical protein